MHRSTIRQAAAAALLLHCVSAPAFAGQVRVGVGGATNTFSPATINANAGDHVVWIWAGLAGHTVTSGVPANGANGSGTFRSSTNAFGNTGKFYSWKAAGLGPVPYYCLPHGVVGMTGTINVQNGSASVADFRITEVEFGANGGADRVQITNLGTDTGFLGHYRFSYATGVSNDLTSDPITITSASRITLHLNATGTNTATDIFLPGAPELGTEGSFALYVPNNTTGPEGSLDPGSLSDPDQMVDYVEWGLTGQPGQPNQPTAVAANLWPIGDVVETASTLPNGGNGYSISFCGSRTDRGQAFWQISTPNFGTGALCTSPTRTATWGRIKTLYR